MNFLMLIFISLFAAEMPALISVVGTCDQELDPDKITITYQVIGKDKKDSNKSAKQANNIYNKILKKVKKLKLENPEYRTENYRTYPHRVWENSKQVLKGYKTEITLKVKTSSKDKASTLLDMGSQLGAARTQGPQAFVSKKLYRKIYNDCLEIASNSAFTKAKSLARFHNVKLGRVFSVAEQVSQNSSIQQSSRMNMMSSQREKSSSNVQIEYGKSNLTISLPVSYLIK